MTPPEPIPAAELLAESAWLERLARRLVGEPGAAADATQEVLTKALAHTPGTGVPLRRWLGTILRNVVRQERRSHGRRVQREADRGLARLEEPADELAARLELHERLVAAVRTLEEPYRTTVALRFLEDLAPPLVAERMGVPLKTVHTRLERALERLRARLDRDYGRREAWLALLLPHFGLPPLALPDPTPLVPFIVMGTLWKWTGAAAALATLGFIALRPLSSPAERLAAVQESSSAPPAAELAPPPSSAPAKSLADPAREVVRPGTSAATPPSSPPAEPALEPLFGFVRDVEQRPVGGLTVEAQPIRATPSAPQEPEERCNTAQSGADGRFELAGQQTLCRIVAHGRGYATLVAPTLMDARPPEPPIVFVGPERAYSGLVVDAAGKPLSGVELALYLAEPLARELVTGTLAAGLPMTRTTSASDGSFAFPLVGGAPGSTLQARADGFGSADLLLPEGSSDELLVTLARSARPAALAGHVLHADGQPAAGAHVSTGEESVRSDESGAFELALEAGAKAERLQAVLPGFLPATLELAGAPTDSHRDLELVLGAPALTLGGRVEDADGRPVAGAKVWTSDGEPFGDIPTRLGEMTLFVAYDCEGVIAGAESQTGGRVATTDADGRFELASLLERSYDLYALDQRTNELVGPVAARAGTSSAVLRLANEARTLVAGRVLSLSGEPQAGARVTAQRSVRRPDGSRGSRLSLDAASGQARWTHARGSLLRTTDAEGRFVYEELCTEDTELTVSRADSPLSISIDLAAEPDLAALELRIPAACHVRILLDDPSRASGVQLRDERDQALDVTLQVGAVFMTGQTIVVAGGVTDMLVTDERARTLVLLKDGKESERIPLHLVPGQVNEVRP